MVQAAKRFLVIGLDGGTFDLIRPWAAQGRLPNLARLLNDGAQGTLLSVPNMNSGPAWSTFMTGVNPGKHGVFFLTEREPGSYRLRPVNGSHRHGPSLWRLLSDRGQDVLAVNVPMTYPAEPVRGAVISGMDAPALRSDMTYPPALLKTLRPAIGRYRLLRDRFFHRGQLERAVEAHLQQVDQHATAALHLMRSVPWQFAIVVFKSTDSVMHRFWRYMQEPDSRWCGAIQRVYEHVDEKIGRLIAQLGESDGLMIMSDHGAGPDFHPSQLLGELLEKLGLLSYLRRPRPINALWRRLIHFANVQLPYPVKDLILRVAPWCQGKAVAEFGSHGIDWGRTAAFPHGTDPVITVNVRGREPLGIVEPGEPYERLLQELCEMLLRVRDGASGRPVVKAVHLARDIYRGPFAGRAPDLLIEWDQDVPVESLLLERNGKRIVADHRWTSSGAAFSGGHRPEGILLLRGPQIRRRAEIRRAMLADLAPTVLYALGEPIPAYMDGRCLLEAFEPEFVAAAPPQYAEVPFTDRASSRQYSRAEEAEIKRRLRALGYL